MTRRLFAVSSFLVLVVGAVITSYPVHAAECDKTAAPSSRALCRDPDLRALAGKRQAALVETLKRLKAKQKKALTADQNRWVKSYAPSCGITSNRVATSSLSTKTKQCLMDAGRSRVTYLQAYDRRERVAPAPTPATPPAVAEAPPPKQYPEDAPPFESGEKSYRRADLNSIKGASGKSLEGARFEVLGSLRYLGRGYADIIPSDDNQRRNIKVSSPLKAVVGQLDPEAISYLQDHCSNGACLERWRGVMTSKCSAEQCLLIEGWRSQ